MLKDLIFIDNYDSFVYNLIDNITTLGARVSVYRNDVPVARVREEVSRLKDEGRTPLLFLSPGPSHPLEAHNLMAFIETLMGEVPMLGVCLGHQALALALGGKVERCPEVVHGQSSLLTHTGRACFKGLPNPLSVGRYHSLYVSQLPSEMEEIATVHGLNMALYSEKLHLLSLQFHPESILSSFGPHILKQSLDCLES